MPPPRKKKVPKATEAAATQEPAADEDAAASLLAEALGRQRIAPSPTSGGAALKATGMAPSDVQEEAETFPLTQRAGGHDLNEHNWAARSQRMAALARKNEVAELEAKLRLGILSAKEQAKLGPTLLAEVEAAAVARQEGGGTNR